MFGSINTGTDYTFTQSETQNSAINKSKAISSYFGNSGVSKKAVVREETKKVAVEAPDTKNVALESVHATKNGSSAPEIKLLGQGNGEEANIDYLYNADGKAASITSSFDALAAAVGGVGGRVTKEQLVEYLHSLKSNPSVGADNIQEITFLKGLIAQFDLMSNDAGYITSLAGVNEPQDYTTVTKEQVTPPVDIRV